MHCCLPRSLSRRLDGLPLIGEYNNFLSCLYVVSYQPLVGKEARIPLTKWIRLEGSSQIEQSDKILCCVRDRKVLNEVRSILHVKMLLLTKIILCDT